MASARLSFESEGKTYTLYFGMASVRVFQERAAKEYFLLIQSGIAEPTQEDLDPIKTLANVLYSGLCNWADINDEQRPPFIDAYQLAEALFTNKEICEQVNNVWGESQPVKEMLERLRDKTQPEEEKKNTKPKTGKKLKPMPQVS